MSYLTRFWAFIVAKFKALNLFLKPTVADIEREAYLAEQEIIKEATVIIKAEVAKVEAAVVAAEPVIEKAIEAAVEKAAIVAVEAIL